MEQTLFFSLKDVMTWASLYINTISDFSGYDLMIFHNYFLRKEKPLQKHITHHYLTTSRQKLLKKRARSQEKRISFYQDNGPSHTAEMTKIYELRFQRLEHPHYSPDTAQSDFFRFLQLKANCFVPSYRFLICWSVRGVHYH